MAMLLKAPKHKYLHSFLSEYFFHLPVGGGGEQIYLQPTLSASCYLSFQD